MSKQVLFATSRADAENYCNENDLNFREVVWALNAPLLSGIDIEGAEVHYTDTFKEMPAYGEAVAYFAPVEEGDSDE